MVWIVIEEGSSDGDDWTAIIGVASSPEAAEKIADDRGWDSGPWHDGSGEGEDRRRTGRTLNGQKIDQIVQSWQIEP